MFCEAAYCGHAEAVEALLEAMGIEVDLSFQDAGTFLGVLGVPENYGNLSDVIRAQRLLNQFGLRWSIKSSW